MNPGLPTYPGRAGTLICSRPDVELGVPLYLIVASLKSTWHFVGQVILRRHKQPVTAKEWKAMPTLVRDLTVLAHSMASNAASPYRPVTSGRSYLSRTLTSRLTNDWLYGSRCQPNTDDLSLTKRSTLASKNTYEQASRSRCFRRRKMSWMLSIAAGRYVERPRSLH